MKLIGIGDGVVDYYKDQELFYPGGSVVNVAVFAKQNGAEKAAYLGIIGTDCEGNHFLDSLAREDIDTKRVRRVEGATGEAVVTLNEEGDRIFIGTNKDIRVQSLVSLQLNKEDIKYLQDYDIIHSCVSINKSIQNELPRLKDKIISYDFSSPEYWTKSDLEEICPYLDYAFFSGSDYLNDEIENLIRDVHSFGVPIVGITRGEKPAIFSKNGQRYKQLPVSTHVVDTMGAGDSFIGAFLTHYHESHDMVGALQAAANFAAMVCQHYGAFKYGKEKK